jgi:FAD:protein FMN transferase
MPSPSPPPCVEAACGAYARRRRARPLLGTLVEIEAAADQPVELLQSAIDSGFAAIERVHALMSYQDPCSELSRLSRNAGNHVQRVDAHTYRVLEAALRIAKLSDGAFDPCVAHQNSAGWRDIELLEDNGVRLPRLVRLDLGGIAKGYAVDLAVRTLQGFGLDQISVNAGGDLRIAGPQHGSIQLRHPQEPSRLAHAVMLRNAALATSATYYSRRLTEGREFSALIDPRSGDPYAGQNSVSVRAPECMTADALTKVVLFADAGIAERCLAAFDAEAYVLKPLPGAVQALAASKRSMSVRSNFNCVAATKSCS